MAVAGVSHAIVVHADGGWHRLWVFSTRGAFNLFRQGVQVRPATTTTTPPNTTPTTTTIAATTPTTTTRSASATPPPTVADMQPPKNKYLADGSGTHEGDAWTPPQGPRPGHADARKRLSLWGPVLRKEKTSRSVVALKGRSSAFDVSEARAFLKEDRERLLAVVEDTFGDLEMFNVLVRDLLAKHEPRIAAAKAHMS